MFKIDQGAEVIINTLYANGFEGYVVGGCVRDLLLHREPEDWDITTNAKPEQVKKLFVKTIETGIKHGTVTVVLDGNNYEVTTYRMDGQYTDHRRPDEVIFTMSLQADLSRRDFTINAMAYNSINGLIDYFNGKSDLEQKIIRAVGNPAQRFQEDALRMMRAIRFSSQLGYEIEPETAQSIYLSSSLVQKVSRERIRDELIKILISDYPIYVSRLSASGLMEYLIPELEYCIDFDQKNPYHDKSVYAHTLEVLRNTPPKLVIRLAALLHDIAKPVTFTLDEQGIGHFYDHQLVGALMAEKILRRLKFDHDTIKRVCILVREHMSRFNIINGKNVKKFINRVGSENLSNLFALQIADVKGCREPHDLSQILNLKKEVERVLKEKQPLTVQDLVINGYDLIAAGIKPGARMGQILNLLLEKVLEDPKLNTKEQLLALVQTLLPDDTE